MLDDWRSISRFSPQGDFLDAHTFSVYGVGRHKCRGGEGARLLITGGRVLSAQTELDGSANPGCPPFPEGNLPYDRSPRVGDPRTGSYDTLAILPAGELATTRRLVYGRGLSVAVAGGRVFAGDTGADSIRVFHVATGERLPSRPPDLPDGESLVLGRKDGNIAVAARRRGVWTEPYPFSPL